MLNPPRRSVAYVVSAEGNDLLIRYHGVTSPDLCLNPNVAIEALYTYQFPLVYVPITQTRANELRHCWRTKEELYAHCESD